MLVNVPTFEVVAIFKLVNVPTFYVVTIYKVLVNVPTLQGAGEYANIIRCL